MKELKLYCDGCGKEVTKLIGIKIYREQSYMIEDMYRIELCKRCYDGLYDEKDNKIEFYNLLTKYIISSLKLRSIFKNKS